MRGLGWVPIGLSAQAPPSDKSLLLRFCSCDLVAKLRLRQEVDMWACLVHQRCCLSLWTNSGTFWRMNPDKTDHIWLHFMNLFLRKPFFFLSDSKFLFPLTIYELFHTRTGLRLTYYCCFQAVLYEHDSSRISSLRRDDSDPRALAYVYENQHSYTLFYIKMANLVSTHALISFFK